MPVDVTSYISLFHHTFSCKYVYSVDYFRGSKRWTKPKKIKMCLKFARLDKKKKRWRGKKMIKRREKRSFGGKMIWIHLIFVIKKNLRNYVCKIGQVGWGYRIQRRNTQQQVSYIIQGWGSNNNPRMGLQNCWSFGEWRAIPLLPGLLCPGVVESDGYQSMGQIELNWILMLNWIFWKRTVLKFKQRTSAKLKCLKWKCFDIWIVYLCLTELFGIEMFLYLNCVVMLHWTVCNIIVLTFELRT